MTCYVDELRQYGNGKWCHLMSDTETIDELDEMALKIGLKLNWVQQANTGRTHYDLRESQRTLAIKCGARAVTSTQLAYACIRTREGELKYANSRCAPAIVETTV